MSVEAEDEFQKELIDLFVQEAHEWLQQIHVALDELQQSPAPDRHVKLAQTIKAGITNLGGSAATINLGDVERASFSAIPFVEAVQSPGAATSISDFVALCKHLGLIHTALTNATGVTFDAESAVASTEAASITASCTDVLAALQRLQQRQTGAAVSPRNLAQAVIAQVEGLIRSGVGQCDVSSLREFLERVAGEEDAFLRAVRQQLPVVTDGINQLKAAHGSEGLSSDHVRPIIEQVAQLWSAAQQVNAVPAISFLKGLHSFLTVVMQHRVAVAAQRFDSVETRLRSMMGVIQVWVEVGREERAAIGSALPSH